MTESSYLATGQEEWKETEAVAIKTSTRNYCDELFWTSTVAGVLFI